LSSAILYLAIVVIWACLLVPRWLRRSHTASFAGTDSGGSEEPEQTSAEYASGDGLAGDPAENAEEDLGPSRPGPLRAVGHFGVRQLSVERPEQEQPEPDTAPIPAITVPRPEPADAPDAVSASSPDTSRPSADALAAPALPARPPISRAKIVQARRRLLTTLILLAVAAATCTALKLTSGWVCVPPAGMLGMYLLLLREAALADAENARWRAQQAHAGRQRARDGAREAWAARTPQPTAEIIDISARLGDQLYDQYADATVRAVGD
jgi:hypothetical protein